MLRRRALSWRHALRAREARLVGSRDNRTKAGGGANEQRDADGLPARTREFLHPHSFFLLADGY
jgi:hypothetical protein